MLRAHAIRSLFDENVEDNCTGFILTTHNGMLQGSSSTLPEPLAKRASALCGLIWRSHADPSFHSTPFATTTHAIEAIGIRRDPTNDNQISCILFTVAEKGAPGIQTPETGSASSPRVRLWGVAGVKERMLVAAAGRTCERAEEVGEGEMLVVANKAEGMAEYLRVELEGFTMPV